MANIIKIENSDVKRFKKREKKKKKSIPCRILIVCEGTKTEPNYFKAFKRINNQSFVVELDIKGEGTNTLSVVDKAISLKNSALSPYDEVWAVFDRDSFPAANVNAAILKAESNGVKAAWSNEAFELWYLYHFCNRNTPMKRDEYKRAISDAVNKKMKNGKKAYIYKKNDENNYSIMEKYGDQAQAIKWAEEQANAFSDKRFSTHNPCTMVYKLINQLLGHDKILIEKIMRKMYSNE